MKIRQYTAPTMQEAILKIKVDLGPDAVILHTRKFKKGGVMGFFAQDMVEVLAAIDNGEKDGRSRERARDGAEREEARSRNREARESREERRVPASREWQVGPDELELGPLAPKNRPAPSPEPARRAPEPVAQRQTMTEEPPARRVETARVEPEWEEELVPEAPRAPEKGVAVAEPPAPTPVLPESHPLTEEVSELKSTVDDLKAMLITIVGQLEEQPRQSAQFPPKLQKVYDRLLACDVDPSIARGLVVYLQREQPHLETYEELVAALEKPVSGLIQTTGPVAPAKGQQKIIALVGPTGVGKTTTIAKLAANQALSRRVDLALFTIDTYRVAAIEQLKTYGDIIGLPVEVVLTPQGLRDALKQHTAKDLILIDTAGRSPYNRMHINELKSFMEIPAANRETHLVLSSTTRLGDLRKIVRNFGSTGVDRLIFTKTDETEVVGGIISIAHETGLPVSYITTGQSVPDDIMVADGPSLARMLIQELKA